MDLVERIVKALDAPPAANIEEYAEHVKTLCTARGQAIGDLNEEIARMREYVVSLRADLWNIAGGIVAVCDSGNVEHARLACMETSPLVDAARAAISLHGLEPLGPSQQTQTPCNPYTNPQRP